MLVESASELMAEAERLAAEDPEGEAAAREAEEKRKAAAAEAAANGVEAEEAEEEAGMTPAQTAQHFAMRNLMNAGAWAGVGSAFIGKQAGLGRP